MGGFEFGDLFKFDKMVAPTILKLVYWLGLVGIVIWAVIVLLGSFKMMSYSVTSGLGMLILSLVGLAFGTLVWRILIEIYMVIFSINDRLGEVRDRLPPK